MDLVRAILLDVESVAQLDVRMRNLHYDEWSKAQVTYHVKIMGQAGLLEVFDISTNDGTEIYPTSLTWAGHDYLDAVRSDTVWARVKKHLAKVGGEAPIDLIRQVATQLLMQSLELG